MEINPLSKEIRRHAIQMVAAAKASHLGGALSISDILAVLYGDVLKVRPEEPSWPDRDRLVLSKGHCCTALYATLALRGFFPLDELSTYGLNGSRLMSHISHKVPGVEFSTGSLGHGLPFACGLALAAKRRGRGHRTFVILSDGELDEGSNWEAILLAPQQGLDNLTVIVDYNQIQSLGRVEEVIDLHPLADKFRACRWAVKEVDGHDHQALQEALGTLPWQAGRPSCLIAHTVKGSGVDFMENNLAWHYKTPDSAQVAAAVNQIEKR